MGVGLRANLTPGGYEVWLSQQSVFRDQGEPEGLGYSSSPRLLEQARREAPTVPDELAGSQPRQPFVREGAAALQDREEAARRIQVQAILLLRKLALREEAAWVGGSKLQACLTPAAPSDNGSPQIHPPPHSPPPAMWTAQPVHSGDPVAEETQPQQPSPTAEPSPHPPAASPVPLTPRELETLATRARVQVIVQESEASESFVCAEPEAPVIAPEPGSLPPPRLPPAVSPPARPQIGPCSPHGTDPLLPAHLLALPMLPPASLPPGRPQDGSGAPRHIRLPSPAHLPPPQRPWGRGKGCLATSARLSHSHAGAGLSPERPQIGPGALRQTHQLPPAHSPPPQLADSDSDGAAPAPAAAASLELETIQKESSDRGHARQCELPAPSPPPSQQMTSAGPNELSARMASLAVLPTARMGSQGGVQVTVHALHSGSVGGLWMPTAVAPARQLFALVEFRCDVPRHIDDGGEVETCGAYFGRSEGAVSFLRRSVRRALTPWLGGLITARAQAAQCALDLPEHDFRILTAGQWPAGQSLPSARHIAEGQVLAGKRFALVVLLGAAPRDCGRHIAASPEGQHYMTTLSDTAQADRRRKLVRSALIGAQLARKDGRGLTHSYESRQPKSLQWPKAWWPHAVCGAACCLRGTPLECPRVQQWSVLTPHSYGPRAGDAKPQGGQASQRQILVSVFNDETVCSLPGCAKPRWVDARPPHRIHDTCGRRHALELSVRTGSPAPATHSQHIPHYRDAENRLHASKVAFVDTNTGNLYFHHRNDGGLDLPGGHRDVGEASAACALIRECVVEELRLPSTLEARLREHAAHPPRTVVLQRRGDTHVVSVWVIPATAHELTQIEQTKEGRAEAHTPEVRSLKEFIAGSPYAVAIQKGLADLRAGSRQHQDGSSGWNPAVPSELTTGVPAVHVGAPPGHTPSPIQPRTAQPEEGGGAAEMRINGSRGEL